MVAGASATKLGISQQPTGGASGAVLTVQPWVAIQDSTGATVTGSAASVSVTSSAGSTLGGTTSVTAVSGIAKFTNLTLAGVAGTSYTLTFTSTGLTQVVSNSVLVTFGAAAKLSISTAPVLGSSGSVMATQPVVTIQDAQGNTVTNSSATVSISIASGAGGTLSGFQSASGVAASSGIAAFTNLAFAGTTNTNYTFTFASPGLTSATTGSMQVSGSSSKIGIYTLPILGSTGYAFAQAPVIAIQDVNGNTVTSDNSTTVTVSIGSGTGGTLGGTLTRTAVNGFTTFPGLTFTGSGTYTLTFTATIGGTSKTASTGSLSLSGSASKITVSTQPVGGSSGGLLVTQPVVRIEDSSGQLVTASALTVSVSVVGASGSLANSSVLTAVASGGIATFSGLKLNGLVGTQYQLSFTSGALTAGTSVNLSVTAGSANKLAISVAPVAGGSGAALATQPEIRVEDVDGNFVSTNSVSVTASINSGASGTLGGTATQTTAAGVAKFTDLTLTGLTTEGYVLKFVATGLTQVLSTTISVTPGSVALANALISVDLNSVTADGSTQVTVTVQARDAQGNSVSGTAGTLLLSVSGGGSISSPTDNADGTYSATYTAGSSTGTATITGTLAGTPITDNAQISLVAGSATQIAVNAGNSQSATAGSAVATAPSVIVKDVNNNPVSGVSVTFAVATGGGSATSTSATTNSSGIATVGSWTLGTTAGSNTLTATSAGLTGSPVTFNATGTAGSATQIAVNAGNSQSATAGSAVATAPSVIVKDANNNPVSGVSVTFAVASGGGTATTTSATTNSSGIATVGSWTLGTTAGSNTLTATAAGLTGSPVTFTATGTAGAASAVTSTVTVSSGTITANGTTTSTITVQLKDSNGNNLTSGGATVTFASPSVGTIGSTTDNGNGTYSATLTAGNTAGTATIAPKLGATNFTNTTSVVLRSQDSTLSGLVLTTATLSPSFASGTTSYTVTVPYTTSSITVTPTVNESHATVTVGGTSVTSGSASGSISLTAGSATTINIVVTAQNGTTSTYSVAVTRTAAATDATLSGLSVTTATISPTFASATTSYSASVPYTTSSVTVTPTVNNGFANVTVNGASVTSGTASSSLSLTAGSATTLTVVVTAQSGATKTYTISVSRASVSNVATLSSLSLSSGTLNSAFSSSTAAYTASVTSGTSSITVTPTVTFAAATIQVKIGSGSYASVTSGSASSSLSLSYGDNTITVLVTAQDGTTTGTYTVVVNRALITRTISLSTPPASLTYGSTATLSATPSAGGSEGLITFSAGSSTGCSISGTTLSVTNASGICAITATISAGATYGSATSASSTVTLNKASLRVTASSPSVTYGDAIPSVTYAFTTADFKNSENVSSSSFTSGLSAPACSTAYTTSSNAGTTPATSCSGGSATNYTFSFVAGSVTINKANPVISWDTPLPIRAGNLTSTELDATASLPGALVFTPSLGSAVTEGTVTLSATFTPADTTNYNVVSKSVNLVVTGATAPNAPNAPTITNVGVTTSSSLAITWTQVSGSNTGGSTITSYQYRYSLATGSPSWSAWTNLAGLSGSSESITVAATSRSYIAQIRACNVVGCSAASPSSSAATSTGVIVSAPVTPTISATLASSGTVTVNYSRDSGTTSYSYSTDDGATWRSVSGTTGTFTFVATKGTSHKIRVRGVNSAGNGTASENAPILWTTIPSVPASVVGTAATTGDGNISIDLNQGDTGGLSTWFEYQVGSGDGEEDNGSYGASVNAGSTEPFNVPISNANGSYRVKVRACNSLGCSSYSSAVRVTSSRARITTQPAGTTLTVGQASGYTLSVIAVPAASEAITYNWYRNGVLIAGATSSTYVLATPITQTSGGVAGDDGSYRVVVHAGSVDLTSDTATVVVNAAPTMATTLPGATVGLSYSYNLVPSGGTPSYTYTLGTLPSGLSYSSENKRISGTVSNSVTPGVKTFSCRITDSKGVYTDATCSITISTPITITTTTLGSASKGSSYSATLAVSGGSAPYTWTLNTGSDPLPAGFTLTSGGAITTNSLNVPDNASSATFEILVTDANGATDTQKLTLSILAGIPNAPQTPAATGGNKTVTLTWTAPVAKPGVTVTNYIISYVKPKGEKSDDGGHDDEERGSISIDGNLLTYTVTGLTNGLPYTFTISAKSSGGTGSPSDPVTATPLGKATPPQSVSAANSRNGISVRWKKPNENGGGSISTWVIVCTSSTEVITKTFGEGDGGEERGDDGQNRYVVYSNDDPESSRHLIPGHTYTCTVAAKTTKNGNTTVGDPSSPSAPVLFATVPSTPPTLSGTYSSDSRTVTATWTYSTDDGGSAITKYIAYMQFGDGEESKRQCFTSDTGTTCVINNISGKGSYALNVVAVNAIGQSDPRTYTVTVTGKTQTITIPSLPDRIIGTADFNVGATSSAGLNLTYSSNTTSKCSVTSKGGLVKMLQVGLCTISVSQNGHKSDENGDDRGEESEYGSVAGTASFNILDRVPSAPTVTTVASGNGQLTINWTAPGSTGGTPSGYQVAVVLASCGADKTLCSYNESTTVGTSPLQLTVTGLTNGSPYYVRVRAINAAGNSAYAYGSSSYTPYGLPGAPTITNITTSPETSTATITWSASAPNGSPITGYTVSASPGTAKCTTGGALSCSISGLTNGTSYTIRVYGTNAAGNSSNAETSTSIAMVSQTIAFNNPIPGMYGYTVGDPNVQFNASASSGLPIQWSTADANICTVTQGGSVRLLSAGACEVIIAQNGKDATGAQTKYGVATYSTNSKQIIIDPATPSAPVITSITNTPNGLVILWNRPSRAGGTLTYTISGVNGSNTTGCADTNVESCTATPSIKGLSYAFTVVATNAAGTSPVSNTKFGTWVVAPSAPRTAATAVANTTDGRAIDLTWTLSQFDGGESITRYVATATEGGNSTTCSVTRTSTLDAGGYSCTIGALKAGVQYSVTVISMNSAGNSPALTIGNVTPGLAQTITLNAPTSSTMTKPIDSSDFTLSATASSGKALSFSTTDTSYCSVNSTTGLVHLIAVGTCVVTVSQAGSTLANPSQFLAASATVTITITPVAPSAATITKVTPGDGQLTIEWNPAASNGGATTTETLTVTNAVGQVVGSCPVSGHTAICTGLTNGQTYNIVVNTTNSQGSTPSLPASGVPFYNALSPLPLTATGGVRSLAVSWQAPAQVDSDKTLHHYVVQIFDGTNWQTAITTSDSATVSGTITQMPVTLASLLNGTTYKLRAIAVATKTGTDFYNGVPTGDVLATTFDLPSKPQTVAATSTGSSIILSWQAPASNGGSSISGYSIHKTYLETTTASTASSSANSATFSAVAGGAYTFTIAASNAVGTGPIETVTVTALNVPGVPVITNVTPNNTNGSAAVTWTAPTSGPTPTSYTAVVYQNGVATAITCTISATLNPLTCNLTGLSYKVPYTIIVYATNAAGNGSNSVASTSFTLHKGQTIDFGAIGNKSFSLGSLALTATASSGLAVTYTSTTTSVCTTTAGSSTVTFVKAGSCSITASQDGVGSDFDAATSVTQTFNVTAETPSSLVLTVVDPGAFKLHATWSAAVDLGGSTLDYYVLSWAKNADFSDEDQMTVLASNSDITGLTQLQQYRVRVQVVAKSGLSSDWSNVLVGTPYGLPAAPTAVVASQLGTGIVQVSWTNSASDGGTPIIGYTVTAYNASTGVATTFTCTAASVTCNVSGLAGSVNYYFIVTATNSVGSANSTPSNNVQPGASQVITPANSAVAHNVAPFANGASVNSGLTLAYAVTAQTNKPTAPVFNPTWGAGRNVCTIAADGTVSVDLAGTCFIQVSQNGTLEGTVGGTPSSFLAAPTVTETVTVAASAPGVTTGLLLTPADGHIDASWIAPTDDGGSPIVKYVVTWYVTANARPSDSDFTTARVAGNTVATRASYGQLWITTPDTTPLATYCDLVGLVNGTTYTVEVTAVNAAGLIGPLN